VLEPCEELIEMALKVQSAGLVRGTWGNLSLRRGAIVWITPSGIPYDALTPDNVVPVSLEKGKPLHNRREPSTELLMHLEIYRRFPEINGVVHTHSIYASAFAAARMEIPCYTEDQAQIIGGKIRVASYAPPGTAELALNVVEALRDRFAALLANHGAVSVGRSLREAYTAAEILEKSAEIAYILKILSPRQSPPELGEGEIATMRKTYLESYGKGFVA